MIDGAICYNMLDIINKCPRRSDKEFNLKFFADQKEYWKWALDPMINYYVKVSDSELVNLPVGTKSIYPRHFDLLKRLSEGYRGEAAKREVMNALGCLDLKNRYVFFTILNKRPNCGVSVKTVNSVFPELLTVFGVQLARVYKRGMKLFTPGKYWTISPKIDGLRGIFINGKFYSRNGKEIPGLTILASKIKDTLPDGFILDGELTVPGKTFNELSGEIRSFKETKDVRYNVFDMTTPGNDNLPLCNRLNVLNHWYTGNHEVQLAGVREVKHSFVADDSQIDKFYNEFISQGYEGAMLKNPDGKRYDGRNKDWLKLKPSYTADVRVVDVERGTGKYRNAIGALIVNYNGRRVKVGSGLTDTQRSAWYTNPNLIVGKTIEVMYMEETEYGSLRHPRFKTVRGDK